MRQERCDGAIVKQARRQIFKNPNGHAYQS
jgi:hypothetical protein